MIDQFLNYLRYERSASPQTVQTYEEGLREFESYISLRDSGLSLQAVDTDLIRDWMEGLMDKGNSASTINKKLSALRSFYRFSLKRGLVEKDPARAHRPRLRQRHRRPVCRRQDGGPLGGRDDPQGSGGHEVRPGGKSQVRL